MTFVVPQLVIAGQFKYRNFPAAQGSLGAWSLCRTEDLSVVGFDDSADTPAYSPPLTTIHQDFAEVGRRSVATILEQLRTGEQKPGTSIVPTRFIHRASTAPVRVSS